MDKPQDVDVLSSGAGAPVGFSDLILSIATNAIAHLGQDEDKDEDRVPNRADLQLAAHHIDMIAMLKEKTRGNLEPEEENLVGTILYELRMKYLEAAQRGG
ncbi:MAG: DUF1844 domain-containing protein [Myxococcales bacterium]|nr:DUF1844 domain-containing protein [Myxococcales bacterium]